MGETSHWSWEDVKNSLPPDLQGESPILSATNAIEQYEAIGANCVKSFDHSEDVTWTLAALLLNLQKTSYSALYLMEKPQLSGSVGMLLRPIIEGTIRVVWMMHLKDKHADRIDAYHNEFLPALINRDISRLQIISGIEKASAIEMLFPSRNKTPLSEIFRETIDQFSEERVKKILNEWKLDAQFGEITKCRTIPVNFIRLIQSAHGSLSHEVHLDPIGVQSAAFASQSTMTALTNINLIVLLSQLRISVLRWVRDDPKGFQVFDNESHQHLKKVALSLSVRDSVAQSIARGEDGSEWERNLSEHGENWVNEHGSAWFRPKK